MLAARYLGPNRIEPIEIPIPEISDGEALVKVEACGFCGSDLGIVAGVHPRATVPLTLGHEFCGTIVAISGTDSSFHVGGRVSACPLVSCGECFVCRHCHPHVCRNLRLFGIDFDGAMAEYVKLPITSLVRLPRGMTPLLGALVEPLAVAVHGVSMGPTKHVQTTVVMGAGPIGLLTALVATAKGLGSVIISDVLLSRLDLARRLGLHAIVAGSDLQHSINESTSGEGADLVFECTGAPSAARQMTALLRPRGTIVNLGVFKKPVEIDMQAVNFKEFTIVGSRVYTREQFEEATALAEILPIAGIVTHTFPLREAPRAFECFRTGNDACKILITPNGAIR